MTAARDAIEAFNRASHSDALREMQLEPAEQWQTDPMTAAFHGAWSLRWAALSGFVLGVLLTIVGVNTL